MKYVLLCSAALLLAACAGNQAQPSSGKAGAASAQTQTAGMPAGALRAGSLSNAKLVNDTMPAAVAQATARGCKNPKNVQPFVKADPSGQPGQRSWQEIWVVECQNGNYPVNITFSETPTGARYVIR